MAEEKDVEMRCVEAVEKSKKVPEQKKQNKGEVEQVSDLSEEDLDVKANVLAVVERMSKQNDPAIQALALGTNGNEVRTATSSMASAPTPLKFLRPLYETPKKAYERMPPGENRGKLADVMGVLAMTTSEVGTRESLKFRLAGHTQESEEVEPAPSLKARKAKKRGKGTSTNNSSSKENKQQA